MRHGKKINHLGRTRSHRHAMLSNMASSLIIHKRLTTTVAKAKALRKYVEPLITKAKTDSTPSRRLIFSYLQNKESVSSLFGEVASRIAERPGGYTRIIKLGDTRLGDNAEMCMIELVDFNDIYNQETTVKKAKTRRGKAKVKKDEEKTAKAPVAKEKPEAKAPEEEIKGETEDQKEEA